MAMFFVNPFAVGGDRVTIPQTDPGDGSVNWVEGFGPDYELNPLVDSDAIDVPRDQTNEFYYQVSLALQEYQTLSVPAFITSSDNLGSPYPYAINAKVRYDDGVHGPLIYQSLVSSNTQTPSFTATQWRNVDNGIAASNGQSQVTYNTGVTDGAAVYWDAGNSRYDLAKADGSVTQNLIGFVNTTTKFVVSSGFLVYTPGGLSPGAPYYLSGTTPGAITATAPASNIVAVGIAITATLLCVSIDNSASSVGGSVPVGAGLDYYGGAVTPGYLLCDGSAVSRTTYAKLFTAIGVLWGPGDGSTTFNLPDSRRRVAMGSGGTGTAIIGNAVGNVGGEEAHTQTLAELAAHTHTYDYTSSSSFSPTSNGGDHDSVNPNVTGGGTGSAGSSTPFNVIQPAMIVTKMIKY